MLRRNATRRAMALTAQDWGAIDASIALYERALVALPSSSSYALNLVHTMEVKVDYRAALQVIERYLAGNAASAVAGAAVHQCTPSAHAAHTPGYNNVRRRRCVREACAAHSSKGRAPLERRRFAPHSLGWHWPACVSVRRPKSGNPLCSQ
jgi:hypothetical protein